MSCELCSNKKDCLLYRAVKRCQKEREGNQKNVQN
jgi:hypothetical protein